MDSFLTSFTINIAKFMEHLIQEFGANVKAIYAGDIAEKENTAIAIYGDEANKGTIYEQVKKQGNKLSCITVKINVNNAGKSRNILFNKDFGIMIFGAFEEEYAIQQIIECTKIVERFLNV